MIDHWKHNLNAFYDTGKYADAIVQAHDATTGNSINLPVHRVILASASSILDTLLSQPPHRAQQLISQSRKERLPALTANQIAFLPLWNLPTQNLSAFESVIEWIYSSRIQLDPKRSWHILGLSIEWGLEPLQKQTEDYVVQEIFNVLPVDVESWYEVLVDASSAHIDVETLSRIMEAAITHSDWIHIKKSQEKILRDTEVSLDKNLLLAFFSDWLEFCKRTERVVSDQLASDIANNLDQYSDGCMNEQEDKFEADLVFSPSSMPIGASELTLLSTGESELDQTEQVFEAAKELVKQRLVEMGAPSHGSLSDSGNSNYDSDKEDDVNSSNIEVKQHQEDDLEASLPAPVARRESGPPAFILHPDAYEFSILPMQSQIVTYDSQAYDGLFHLEAGRDSMATIVSPEMAQEASYIDQVPTIELVKTAIVDDTNPVPLERSASATLQTLEQVNEKLSALNLALLEQSPITKRESAIDIKSDEPITRKHPAPMKAYPSDAIPRGIRNLDVEKQPEMMAPLTRVYSYKGLYSTFENRSPSPIATFPPPQGNDATSQLKHDTRAYYDDDYMSHLRPVPYHQRRALDTDTVSLRVSSPAAEITYRLANDKRRLDLEDPVVEENASFRGNLATYRRQKEPQEGGIFKFLRGILS